MVREGGAGQSSEEGLLKLCVLGFGFVQKGKVGIGILPEGEKILIRTAALLCIALQRERAGQSEVSERNERVGRIVAPQRQNALKLLLCFFATTCSQECQAANIE